MQSIIWINIYIEEFTELRFNKCYYVININYSIYSFMISIIFNLWYILTVI